MRPAWPAILLHTLWHTGNNNKYFQRQRGRSGGKHQRLYTPAGATQDIISHSLYTDIIIVLVLVIGTI